MGDACSVTVQRIIESPQPRCTRCEPAITAHQRSTATKLHFVRSTKFRSSARYDSVGIKSHDMRNFLGKTSTCRGCSEVFRRSWLLSGFYDVNLCGNVFGRLEIELTVIFVKKFSRLIYHTVISAKTKTNNKREFGLSLTLDSNLFHSKRF